MSDDEKDLRQAVEQVKRADVLAKTLKNAFDKCIDICASALMNFPQDELEEIYSSMLEVFNDKYSGVPVSQLGIGGRGLELLVAMNLVNEELTYRAHIKVCAKCRAEDAAASRQNHVFH